MKAKRRTKIDRYPGVYRSVSGRYEIAYRDSDGKLRFKAVGTNLQDAVAARAEIVGKVRKGVRVAPVKLTFQAWSGQWLDGLSKRPRTIDAYRYALDRHLLPRFKNRRVADITVDDVAKLIREMEQAGYAGWTTMGALSTLSGCLGKAKRRGLIPVNPVSELERDERPSLAAKDKRVLGEREIASLLRNGESFRPVMAVMVFSGLRMAETLAVRWQDIDFEAGFIRVRWQLDLKRGLVELKTESGSRDVVLMPQLAKLLRAHRMASRRKATTDFVFPSPDGRGRDQRSTSRGIQRALKRAGLEGEGLSAHAFRHTFASLLIIGLKLDPVTVSKQLGHANPATTLRVYAHLFDQARHADATRQAMGAKFGHLLTLPAVGS
jgi:integrase